MLKNLYFLFIFISGLRAIFTAYEVYECICKEKETGDYLFSQNTHLIAKPSIYNDNRVLCQNKTSFYHRDNILYQIDGPKLNDPVYNCSSTNKTFEYCLIFYGTKPVDKLILKNSGSRPSNILSFIKNVFL